MGNNCKGETNLRIKEFQQTISATLQCADLLSGFMKQLSCLEEKNWDKLYPED